MPAEWQIEGLVQINEDGVILAKARKTVDGTPSSSQSIVLLSPVEFTTSDITAGFDYPINGDPANPLWPEKDERFPQWWASVGQGPETVEGLNIRTHVRAELSSDSLASRFSIRVHPDDTDWIELSPAELTGRMTDLTITGKPRNGNQAYLANLDISVKPNPDNVIRSLNVLSMPNRLLPVRVCYVYDPYYDPTPQQAAMGNTTRPKFRVDSKSPPRSSID